MSVTSKERLLKKLTKKAYRDAYSEESVKTSLPFQIKAMREQRDWSQAILGKKTDMKQNAVSRLESAEYGNLSINTLIRLANAFDCGLLVKFVPFSRLVREFEDVSPSALEVSGFDEDLPNLKSWASNIDWSKKITITSDVIVYSTESSPQNFNQLSDNNVLLTTVNSELISEYSM